MVDRLSLDYFKGSQLDYKADLMGSAFKISTPWPPPNAAAGPASPFDLLLGRRT